ncbi:MAG TPA: NADP-dependent oxidoreductase [Thermoplasmata archaeon]|nr:NADP-dependent oxidoreductase [Thermoplasmata archaeon]
MRAVAVRKFKDVPEMMDLPKPEPGPGEILVKLGAAGVNPYDWKIVDGVLDGVMPHVFPLILGVDGAGVVETCGPGASRFKPGMGVYGQFIHPPAGIGTYAEYVTAPESLAIAEIPRGIYTAQAAAVPTPAMTALAALDALNLHKGQTLFVAGAKGGIGSFVVQLGSNQGIMVMAASRGDHGAFLRKLGAFLYIDAGRYGYLEEFRTGHPEGVDAALDLFHPAAEFEPIAGLVKPGGIAASTIGAAGSVPTDARGVHRVNVDLAPKMEYLERLGKEISTGRLRIPLEAQLPLAEAPEIVAQSRAGSSRGKTVLLI